MKWWPSKKSKSDKTQSSKSIESIFIAESAYKSDDPADLVAFNVNFVNAMLNEGAYLSGELPKSAMRSYYVDYYLAQVVNGGHGQFLGNSNWNANILEFVGDGLHAMEAEQYVSIFSEFRRFLDEEPARGVSVAQACGFDETPDPVIADLDSRFYAQDPYETLTPANADWLRSLPELRVVPDDEYRDVVNGLYEANTQRTARLAVRQRETIEGSLRDEIRVASRLLCVQANCLPFIGVRSGQPDAVAPDGRKGVGWTIDSKAGRQVVFVLDDFAYLCETYLADGRKVTDELVDAQNQAMLKGEDLPDFSAFASRTEKEVARIPAAMIAAAIAAAEQTPVVKIAQLLCNKLAFDENLEDVFAIGPEASGQWLWLMQTNKRIGVVGSTRKGFELKDMDRKSLAILSNRELKKALDAEIVGHA